MQKLKEFVDDPAVFFQVEVRENMCQLKKTSEAETDLGYYFSVYVETDLCTKDPKTCISISILGGCFVSLLLFHYSHL